MTDVDQTPKRLPGAPPIAGPDDDNPVINAAGGPVTSTNPGKVAPANVVGYPCHAVAGTACSRGASHHRDLADQPPETSAVVIASSIEVGEQPAATCSWPFHPGGGCATAIAASVPSGPA